jgi:hypothetical protein
MLEWSAVRQRNFNERTKVLRQFAREKSLYPYKIDSINSFTEQELSGLRGRFQKDSSLSTSLRLRFLDKTYAAVSKAAQAYALSQDLIYGSIYQNGSEYSTNFLSELAKIKIEQPSLLGNPFYMNFLYWQETIAYKNWLEELSSAYRNAGIHKNYWYFKFLQEYYQNDTITYIQMLRSAYMKLAALPEDFYLISTKIVDLFPEEKYIKYLNQHKQSFDPLQKRQSSPSFYGN